MLDNESTFDYIVVGAGSAGCAVAHRLSEDPGASVLLLEAGPRDRKLEVRIPAAFPKLFKTPLDWNYSTEPQPRLAGRSLYWPRGKMLGGSSSMNAQLHVRGHVADFDGWSASGLEGWSSADVLACFRRTALASCELRDPNPMTRAFIAAAVEAGLRPNPDFNGPTLDGVGQPRVTQWRGARSSAADVYLRPARGRRNLEIATGAHATRILFAERRASGVECRMGARLVTLRARREIVLSGGSVNTPQLLMLSGIGPGDRLRSLGIDLVRDAPAVGRNLQDHLMVAVVMTALQPISLLGAESLGNLARFLLLRRGPLTSNVAEACAFARSDQGLPAPDLELIFAPVAFIDHGLVKESRHCLSTGVVLLQPRSRGEVTLRSADPLAAPAIDPRYLSDSEGHDLRVLVCGLRLVRRILGMPALAPHVGDAVESPERWESEAALEDFIRAQAETLYHPVGTCAMGAGEDAVVDARLRVRGVEGLRIADCSVMPSIVRGHTHAAAVMIGERAADFIRAD